MRRTQSLVQYGRRNGMLNARDGSNAGGTATTLSVNRRAPSSESSLELSSTPMTISSATPNSGGTIVTSFSAPSIVKMMIVSDIGPRYYAGGRYFALPHDARA